MAINILPSSKSDVQLKFANSLINNTLRVSFINQNTKQIVFQDTFMLVANQIIKTISRDTLTPEILLRIEDLTQKKTLKIVRW